MQTQRCNTEIRKGQDAKKYGGDTKNHTQNGISYRKRTNKNRDEYQAIKELEKRVENTEFNKTRDVQKKKFDLLTSKRRRIDKSHFL